MSYKIIISAASRQKLKQIATYIAQDNSPRAISFIDEMQASFQQTLAIMPYSGREIKPQLRMLPLKRYNIFYQVNEAERSVYVLDIFAGSQNCGSRV